MEIEFVAASAAMAPKTALARVVFEGAALEGALAQAAAASRFTGAKGQTLDVLAPSGVDAPRLVLVGLGKPDSGAADATAIAIEHAAASAYAAVKASGLAAVRIELPDAGADLAAHAA